MEVTEDNKASKVDIDHQQEVELPQGIPAEMKTNVSVADCLATVPKIIPKRTYLQSRHNIEKKEFISTGGVCPSV